MTIASRNARRWASFSPIFATLNPAALIRLALGLPDFVHGDVVDAPNGRLDWGFAREWTGLTGVPTLIAGVVLAIAVDIFEFVFVMLKRGHGTNEIGAGIEHVEHRLTIDAEEPVAHLIPASYPGIICWPEDDLCLNRHALSVRRPSVDLEARRVSYSVGDAIATFEGGDTVGNLLSSEL